MTTDSKKPGDMSVEDILKSIKGIISGHNKNNIPEEEVLELTNIIKEGRKNDHSIKPDNVLKEENSEDYLISEKSANETSNIFKNFANKATMALHAGKKSKNLSMEELVIEMMRPQLSKWLNDNLPELVKDLVEKEIKRLVPDE